MHRLIYHTKTSFKEAIELLDKNGNGILPIVNKENKLVGIITDGDVRRSILNNTMTLEKTINFKPQTLPDTTSRKEAISYLNRIHRRHIPLVNEEGTLVDFVILDDFEVHSKPNLVVLMVGGLGSRLGALTESTPKPMLKVGDKPLLENILVSFKSQGFTKFILCVNYKSHIIEDYFGNGEKLGVSIEYTREKLKMGTAGALSLVNANLINEPFIVSNGDILTTIDFEEALQKHETSENQASLLIKQYHHVIPYATVNFDENNRLVNIKEKPQCSHSINSGIYIFNPQIINLIPEDKFYDMPDLIQELLGMNSPVGVINTEEYWLDVGRPEEYEKANRDLDPT